MPRTTVVFYQEEDGTAPRAIWFRRLRRTNPRAFANCVVKLERLGELGHELRRPAADTLRDGIHELRVRRGHANYRMLYSIHDRVMAILLHALTKEAAIPDRELDLAVVRRKAFEHDPAAHIFTSRET